MFIVDLLPSFCLVPDRCADEGIICDGNADCITLVEMAPYCQCKLGYSGDGYNCYGEYIRHLLSPYNEWRVCHHILLSIQLTIGY